MILKILIILGLVIIFLLVIIALCSLMLYPVERDITTFVRSMRSTKEDFKNASLYTKVMAVICTIFEMVILGVTVYTVYVGLMNAGIICR